jgi:lysophospholipid acyltransferase
MPTLLEYLGYVYFFGGVLVGPAFEFADYHDFITLELFRASEDANGGVQKNRTKNGLDQYRRFWVPDGFRAAMNKLGFAVFWAVALLLVGSHYPVTWALTDAYAEKSFLYK